MNTDMLFKFANIIALGGWLALFASPFMRQWADRIADVVIPSLLSIAYTGLIMAFWTRTPGGFDSLPNVMLLFTKPEIALAGWLHYLAFDLFVGAWEVKMARTENITFWLVAPCLVLTFLFGPAGFLLFTAIRLARAGVHLAKDL